MHYRRLARRQRRNWLACWIWNTYAILSWLVVFAGSAFIAYGLLYLAKQ